MNKKKLVVLTGAGISKESGIPTFRDAEDGLWENVDLKSVCYAGCLDKNEENVHKFYNDLREKYRHSKPNEAHELLAELEKDYDVYIITQNVDNLHEQAGSTKVYHLHGELMKCRDIEDRFNIYDIPERDGRYNTTPEMEIDGHLVRPHVVFFGEDVYNLEKAEELVKQADIFLIVGTSLNVYPAAGLISYVEYPNPIYYIDPYASFHAFEYQDVNIIQDIATRGMKKFVNRLKGERNKE